MSGIFQFPPVPDGGPVAARKAGYRTEVPIDRQHPAHGEPCIDVRRLGLAGRNHYAHPDNPPYRLVVPGSVEALWVRRSVADRLLGVNRRLEPMGLEVFLFDAWRPQAVQRYFHDVWFPAWLRARRPDLDETALWREVETYWAAPSQGETSPSPHATGGAIDLTLVWRTSGHPLHMGTVFDDPTDVAWTDWFEREPLHSISDQEARENRRLLYAVMIEAGFCNNPSEWWHFSWGDQMWARLTGADAAAYGACDPSRKTSSSDSA